MHRGSLLHRAFSSLRRGAWRVVDLYYDGFRHMTLGRTLWAIIAIKLFIMFAILKVFFFPNFLKQHAPEGQEPDFVATEMIERSTLSDV